MYFTTNAQLTIKKIPGILNASIPSSSEAWTCPIELNKYSAPSIPYGLSSMHIMVIGSRINNATANLLSHSPAHTFAARKAKKGHKIKKRLEDCTLAMKIVIGKRKRRFCQVLSVPFSHQSQKSFTSMISKVKVNIAGRAQPM